MYAILRLNRYQPGAMATASEDLAAFDRLHASQPGYSGSLQIDLGQGSRFVVNLWSSAEDARAAQQVLVPELQRTLEPLMSAPSSFVGAGTVVNADLPPSARSA